MKNIYICHTYYHLLIAIIKAMNDKNFKSDLILSADRYNKFLVNDKRIIHKLKESKIFDKIILFDYTDIQQRIEKKQGKSFLEPLEKYIFMKRVSLKINIEFSLYSKIFIFNDTSLIGRILNLKKLYYILLEDGKDCYKYNKQRIKGKKTLRKFLKSSFLGMYDMGESKYVKYIEVNDENGIYVTNKKIIENNKEKLFDSLNEFQKKIIWNIFIDKIKINEIKNAILIITQPIWEDNLVNTEFEKINIYKKIIETIPSSSTIIIKKHPRETTNYRQYFKNIMILDNPFPIEILNFSDKIKIKKAITISSTSITSIKNCENIEILGWEWLKK